MTGVVILGGIVIGRLTASRPFRRSHVAIAVVVAIFVVVLSLSQGLSRAFVRSGREDQVLVLRPNARVEALRAALAACKDKGNFFSQQLCIQEMRWKYSGAPLSADPLWGKVAECPNSTQQSNNP